MHPTAAVCGTPTAERGRADRELEGMDRGRYAGPVGWLDARGDGEFGLALRCAELTGAAGARLFAGCGIVAGSDPAAELAETQAKFAAVRGPGILSFVTSVAPGSRDPRESSTRALAAALHTGDFGVIEACTEDLLAPDVCWIGTRGGACHSRDEVLTVLRTQLDEGLVLELVELLPLGDQVLLQIGLRPRGGTATAGMPWRVVLTLDANGLIVHMRDYSDAAVARGDMQLRAAGPEALEGRQPAGGVAALVPFVHVSDVDVSASFYALLGFEAGASHRHGDELQWVSLSNGSANIMLALADAPVIAAEQAVLFYLYSPDLYALRDQLVAHGILVGEIGDGSPGPRQEMRLTDPDGYCLTVAQIDVAGRRRREVRRTTPW